MSKNFRPVIILEVCHNGFKYEIIGSDAILTGFDKNNMPDLSYRHTIPHLIDGKTVVAIAARAFYRSCLRLLGLPSTITRIGDYAFAGSFLEGIWFQPSFAPNSTNNLTVGENAFENCVNLKVFSADKELSVSYKSFLGCGQLKTDNNTLTIRTLQAEAFTNCFSVTTLSIADCGLLKQNCFRGTNIKELIVMDNVQLDDGVVQDLINYGISITAIMDSQMLDLAYLGVEITEQMPF